MLNKHDRERISKIVLAFSLVLILFFGFAFASLFGVNPEDILNSGFTSGTPSEFALNNIPPDILQYCKEAQDRFNVSWAILAAICSVESNFQTNLVNPTPVNGEHATGPMQFLPSTFNECVSEYKKETGDTRNFDINSKEDSIFIAGYYLIKKLGFDKDPNKALTVYGGGNKTLTVTRFGRTFTGSYSTIIQQIADLFSEQVMPLGSIDYSKYPEIIQREMAIANDLVNKQIPYVYGGGHGQIASGYNPDQNHGLDCSSFVAYIIYHATGDSSWDTTADVQYKKCTPISVDQLQPGDLLFYSSTGSVNNITHVAIYVGGGYMAQEHHKGLPAEYSKLNLNAGWFVAAGRP